MSDDPYTHTGPISGSGAPQRSPRAEAAMARTKQAARAGVTMGTALAITISWSANHSILWAILHGFLSWLYVVYYAIRY
jgi:hypothetical protein